MLSCVGARCARARSGTVSWAGAAATAGRLRGHRRRPDADDREGLQGVSPAVRPAPAGPRPAVATLFPDGRFKGCLFF